MLIIQTKMVCLLTLVSWLGWCDVPTAVGGVFCISSCFWWLGCDGEVETIKGFALTFPVLWSLIATPLSISLLWPSFCDCVTCWDTVTIASEDGDVVTYELFFFFSNVNIKHAY